jgi:4,5-dihydroxyphthalate decarboxylase
MRDIRCSRTVSPFSSQALGTTLASRDSASLKRPTKISREQSSCPDPWAYGLEANRHVLDKFLLYCHAQGISARRIAPEELFHPSTVNLAE